MKVKLVLSTIGKMNIPKEVVHSPSFQSFMSVHDEQKHVSWEEVERRMRAYFPGKVSLEAVPSVEKLTKLCLGLAKYDLNGSPSNWDPRPVTNTRLDSGSREAEIYEWGMWVMFEHPEGVDRVISSYDQGFIPDCYAYLEEYYT
jgi:hypothetical protein